MDLTPQQLNAVAQKRRVREAIIAAIAMIRAEISSTYDPETGLHHYDKNGGRVSVAEILRRAGNIDKKTIKEDYHKQTRASVRRLIGWAKRKCDRSIDHAGEWAKEAAASDREQLAHLRQLLGAAEARRDIAEQKAKVAISNERKALAAMNGLQSKLDELSEINAKQWRRLNA